MAGASVEEHQHVFRFPGTLQGFEQAAGALRAVLDQRRVEGLTRHNIELVFEEVAVNIVRHGSPTEAVSVTVAFDGPEVVMTFEDDGVPFDPRLHADPKLPLSLDDAKVGGLGVMLVRKLAHRLDYQRTAGERNLLAVALPLQ